MLLAAVPAVALPVTGRDAAPGRFLTWAYRLGWFFFTTRLYVPSSR